LLANVKTVVETVSATVSLIALDDMIFTAAKCVARLAYVT